MFTSSNFQTGYEIRNNGVQPNNFKKLPSNWASLVPPSRRLGGIFSTSSDQDFYETHTTAPKSTISGVWRKPTPYGNTPLTTDEFWGVPKTDEYEVNTTAKKNFQMQRLMAHNTMFDNPRERLRPDYRNGKSEFREYGEMTKPTSARYDALSYRPEMIDGSGKLGAEFIDQTMRHPEQAYTPSPNIKGTSLRYPTRVSGIFEDRVGAAGTAQGTKGPMAPEIYLPSGGRLYQIIPTDQRPTAGHAAGNNASSRGPIEPQEYLPAGGRLHRQIPVEHIPAKGRNAGNGSSKGPVAPEQYMASGSKSMGPLPQEDVPIAGRSVGMSGGRGPVRSTTYMPAGSRGAELNSPEDVPIAGRSVGVSGGRGPVRSTTYMPAGSRGAELNSPEDVPIAGRSVGMSGGRGPVQPALYLPAGSKGFGPAPPADIPIGGHGVGGHNKQPVLLRDWVQMRPGLTSRLREDTQSQISGKNMPGLRTESYMNAGPRSVSEIRQEQQSNPSTRSFPAPRVEMYLPSGPRALGDVREEMETMGKVATGRTHKWTDYETTATRAFTNIPIITKMQLKTQMGPSSLHGWEEGLHGRMIEEDTADMLSTRHNRKGLKSGSHLDGMDQLDDGIHHTDRATTAPMQRGYQRGGMGNQRVWDEENGQDTGIKATLRSTDFSDEDLGLLRFAVRNPKKYQSSSCLPLREAIPKHREQEIEWMMETLAGKRMRGTPLPSSLYSADPSAGLREILDEPELPVIMYGGCNNSQRGGANTMGEWVTACNKDLDESGGKSLEIPMQMCMATSRGGKLDAKTIESSIVYCRDFCKKHYY